MLLSIYIGLAPDTRFELAVGCDTVQLLVLVKPKAGIGEAHKPCSLFVTLLLYHPAPSPQHWIELVVEVDTPLEFAAAEQRYLG